MRLARPGDITVGIDDLKASTPEADRAVTEFRQAYASPTYQDVSVKRLDWVREGDRWKIQREQMLGSPQNVTVPELIKPTTRKKRTRARNCKCD